MSEQPKKIRLIRVAKEFNVGLSSIVDFLHKKGIEIDSSPNTQIEPDTYAILEKEYGKNRPKGNELDSVRERMMRGWLLFISTLFTIALMVSPLRKKSLGICSLFGITSSLSSSSRIIISRFHTW